MKTQTQMTDMKKMIKKESLPFFKVLSLLYHCLEPRKSNSRTKARNMKITHKPGKTIQLTKHVDILANPQNQVQRRKVAEGYANYLAYNSSPKTTTLESIVKETLMNKTLSKTLKLRTRNKSLASVQPGKCKHETLKDCAEGCNL
ncbi:hypothetical protein PoB_003910200 [Plakobranchus ocellatus]|uniref:Uncharacterized protein n=1 Tax=Plakobranchus ocellatus TaxID=259542 RepID=A0AAV4AZY1_9GAST|nr:hypothetical protein PoB_003910200 [Plakobranchus ocellatus]